MRSPPSWLPLPPQSSPRNARPASHALAHTEPNPRSIARTFETELEKERRELEKSQEANREMEALLRRMMSAMEERESLQHEQARGAGTGPVFLFVTVFALPSFTACVPVVA